MSTLSSIYTNTSNFKGVAGLLILTVGLAYAQQHATEIVDGAVSIGKKAVAKVECVIHDGKEKVYPVFAESNGRVKVGKAVWRN